MMHKANQSSEKLYVVYDGHCKLCLASVSKLKELPSTADLLFVTIEQAMETNNKHKVVSVPGLHQATIEALYEKMHVADEHGRLFAGADGVIRIMRTVKGLRYLSAFYYVPGMRRLADLLYRYVANRRYDWFGSTEQSCSISGCEWTQGAGEENKSGK